MPALVAATGLPPAELVSQLASLAGSKEVSFDLGKQQALAWKVRVPIKCSLWGQALPQSCQAFGRICT